MFIHINGFKYSYPYTYMGLNTHTYLHHVDELSGKRVGKVLPDAYLRCLLGPLLCLHRLRVLPDGFIKHSVKDVYY
jgi:hypothetical protein